jgi:hypothetical protein
MSLLPPPRITLTNRITFTARLHVLRFPSLIRLAVSIRRSRPIRSSRSRALSRQAPTGNGAMTSNAGIFLWSYSLGPGPNADQLPHGNFSSCIPLTSGRTYWPRSTPTLTSRLRGRPS